MKYGIALLARLGLQSKETKAPDAFDLRLRRLQLREAKRSAQQGLFKSQQSPQAA